MEGKRIAIAISLAFMGASLLWGGQVLAGTVPVPWPLPGPWFFLIPS